MKRSSLKQKSDHRREINAERARRQEEAWGPRPWKCEFWDIVKAAHVTELPSTGRCYGAVNGHEILSRALAGRTDENLLDIEHQRRLCNFHNGWCDDHPIEARAIGLAISYGDEWTS
jgi:hypothetical protein